jgi:hypothetical protein
MTVFPKDKQCSKCGETFNCGGLLGCWCSDVKLDPATLAALKERYDNCLCPSCLKTFSAAAVSPDAQHVV